MIDCCAQVLQFTPCSGFTDPTCIAAFAGFPGLSSAPSRILATSRAGHIGEHERLPKLSELHQALPGFDRPCMLRHHITIIDVQNIDHRDVSGITAALAVGLVLAGDMFGELSFRAFMLACSAASPDFARSIADDPGGSTHHSSNSVALLGFEPEPSPFGLTRHFFLISSILRSVVNSLPATFSTLRFPRSLSRRSPDTVMPPSGKAILTAVSRRNGASGSTALGSNDECKRCIGALTGSERAALRNKKGRARSRRCDLRSAGAVEDVGSRRPDLGPPSNCFVIRALRSYFVKTSVRVVREECSGYKQVANAVSSPAHQSNCTVHASAVACCRGVIVFGPAPTVRWGADRRRVANAVRHLDCLAEMRDRFLKRGAAQRLIAGLAPPFDGRVGHARLREVISERFRLSRGGVGEAIAQDLCRAAMQDLAPAFEQILIGSGTPLSVCLPRSSATNSPATWRCTRPVTNTAPGSAPYDPGQALIRTLRKA